MLFLLTDSGPADCELWYSIVDEVLCLKTAWLHIMIELCLRAGVIFAGLDSVNTTRIRNSILRSSDSPTFDDGMGTSFPRLRHQNPTIDLEHHSLAGVLFRQGIPRLLSLPEANARAYSYIYIKFGSSRSPSHNVAQW
jgi:hypothetical protein